MKTQFIVHCWLDAEKILGVSQKNFAIKLRSADWVEKRIRIFRDFTLRSLLNQTFDDFRIFLFCGQRFRSITEKFDFGMDRVERIYDYGQRAYQEIEADQVSIMRIDSDDLFHEKIMMNIRSLVSCKHKTFSFRNVIQWNTIHNFITDIKIIISPFTNHVFPKSIYKDFDKLRTLQFGGYRSAPELFSPKFRRVCVIRHRQNVTWPRINKNPRSERYRQEEMTKRNNIILARPQIIKMLKPFGIPENLIPRRS